MLVPASKSQIFVSWFNRYTRYYIKKNFHAVHLLGSPPSFPSVDAPPSDPSARPTVPNIPLLVCLNHSSWWDVLIGLLIEDALFGWEWYTAMDARQLARYRFFSRLGVIGVDRTSLKGAREFIDYSTDLLKSRRRSLWLTPQGEMVSNYARPLRFQPGLAHIAEKLESFYLVRVALHYEFWNEKLPEAFVSISNVEEVRIEQIQSELFWTVQIPIESASTHIAPTESNPTAINLTATDSTALNSAESRSVDSKRRESLLIESLPLEKDREKDREKDKNKERNKDNWNRRNFIATQERALESQLDALLEAIQSRDKTRFTPLLHGGDGISPVYDGLRYIRAKFRGENFSPEHSAIDTPQWQQDKKRRP